MIIIYINGAINKMIYDSESFTQITQLSESIGTSRKSLNEKIKSIGATLFFNRPRNTSIWLSGLAIVVGEEKVETFQSLLDEKKGTPFSKDHSHCIEIDDDIKFLPIEISDWIEISKTGEVLKRSFKHVFTYSHSRGLAKISANEKLKSYFGSSPAIVVEAEFFITSKLDGTHPEEVSIKDHQILIGSDDAERIINEKYQAKEIQKEDWVSENLFYLNEASDVFISPGNITKENREKSIDEIKYWLSKRLSSTAKDLLHQAALSILPNELYGESPKKINEERIMGEYPEYASSALIMINEAAFFSGVRPPEATAKNTLRSIVL